jgi:hypothetical protein
MQPPPYGPRISQVPNAMSGLAQGVLIPASYSVSGNHCSKGQDISSAQYSRSSSLRGWALIIMVFTKTKGDWFLCIWLLAKKSVSAPSAPVVPCGDRKGKELSSASGCALPSFGPIVVMIATCGFGASTALIKSLTELRTAPTLAFAPNSRNSLAF